MKISETNVSLRLKAEKKLISCLSACLSGKFDYDPNLETCSIVKDSYGRTSKTFLFVMGFLIPCVVIVGCYAKIFWVVHK